MAYFKGLLQPPADVICSACNDLEPVADWGRTNMASAEIPRPFVEFDSQVVEWFMFLRASTLYRY